MKRGLTANATRLLILLLGISNYPVLANSDWTGKSTTICEATIVGPNTTLSHTIDPCQSGIGLLYFEAGTQSDCEVPPSLSFEVSPNENISIYPVYEHNELTTYAFLAPEGEYEVVLSAVPSPDNEVQRSFHVSFTSTPYPEIHLACNDTLQLPVGETCQVEITPDMLLEGEFGCLEASDFVIAISDEDPSNGAILDGAGLFKYKITREEYLASEGFSGPFAIDLWRSSTSGNAQMSWAEEELKVDIGPGEGTSFAVALRQVPLSGRLTFDWNYNGEGVAPFFMVYLAHANGLVQVIHTSDGLEQGALAEDLPAGALLVIEVRTEVGAEALCSLALTNWRFEPLRSNTSFFSCAGFLDAIDTQVPVLTCPAISVQNVLCTDADRLLINHLPAGTPYCYELDSSGEVVYPTDEAAAAALDSLLNWIYPFGYPHAGDEEWHGSLIENCQPVEICISDQLQSGEDCEANTINRTFTATDPSGNTSSCEQTILIQTPGIEQVISPPTVAYVSCDVDYPQDGNAYPHPDFTGWPKVQTAFGEYDISPEICNLVAFYEDSPLIEVCSNANQFIRSWQIVDWCRSEGEPIEFFQTIKIGDVTPPTIYCPTNGANGDTLIFQVGPFDCYGSLWVPNPSVEDNCSETWEVISQIVSYPIAGEPAVVLAEVPNDGSPRYISQIPLGVHYFRYTVTDDCGNESIAECPFVMIDDTAPVASCDDVLNVSLDTQGLAQVSAEMVNEGSWDECGIDKMEVRRWIGVENACQDTTQTFTPWGEVVELNCCDLDSLVKVELLVTDLAGNEGSCWLNILVEDKILPTCIPPHDTTILCNELPYFENDSILYPLLEDHFGVPSAADNCSASWEELVPVLSLDQCGEGEIIRTFRVVDGVGNEAGGTCQQTITVGLAHEYEILFPKDARAECGLPAPDTIMTYEVGCDLLAVSVEDEIFNISPDACFIVNRTFRVINWCEYDGEADPVVISREEDCDGEVGDEAVWVINRNGQAFVDRDNDPNNNIPEAGEKGTDCDGETNPEGYWREVTSNGYWEYTQVLEIYDNTAPSVFFAPPPPFCSFNNVTCKAPVEYFFLVFEACSPLDISFEIFYDEDFDGELDEDVPTEGIDGEYPKFRIIREYPIGSHAFVIFATDGCGNTSRTDLPFDVVDCYIDPPICINGLAIELSPVEPGLDVNGDGFADTGAGVIWATDFLASLTTDCLGPLDYSINVVGEEVLRDQTSLVFTCEDVPSVAVEIYSWDNAGNPYKVQPDGTQGGPNFDKCQTYILVQDNLEAACGETAIIGGTIQSEVGVPIVGAPILLSGEDAPSVTAQTGAGGAYELRNVQTGYDYTVAPRWNEDPLRGVTTFDLILITKHILGVSYLDSPYKLLAADINNSGNVTTIDLISLRRLILGIDEELTSNTSWRFIDDDFVFPNPQNPWTTSFPEGVSLNNLNAIEAGSIDFTGLKIGDVNNSVATSYRGNGDLSIRHEATAYISLPEMKWGAGDRLRIPVSIKSAEALKGFQFSLQLDRDAVSIEDIHAGLLEAGNWGTRFLADGMLTISWNPATGDVLRAMEEKVLLMELEVVTKQAGTLSEYMSLEGFTAAEAYGTDNELLNLKLDTEESTQLNFSTSLLQNYPNPFVRQTKVQFEMGQSGTVRFQVFAADGRQIFAQKLVVDSGLQELAIGQKTWPTGVLYLQMTTAEGKWSQKLIHISEK